MNIPPKYEDVVAKLEAALAREAGLIANSNQHNLAMDAACGEIELLQQRLTVAEQRAEKLTGILRDVSEYVRHPDYDWFPCDKDAVSEALKQAAEAERCFHCNQPGGQCCTTAGSKP